MRTRVSKNPLFNYAGRAAALAFAFALSLAARPAQAVTGPTLTGTVSYTNTDANVNSGNFVVVLTSAAPANGGGASARYFQVARTTMSAAGAYAFYNLPDGKYYISCYRDVNGNGQWDAGEPWGAYASLNAQNQGSNVFYTGLAVQGGAVQSPAGPYNFTINDPGTHHVKGTVSYSGASTGTLIIALRMPNPYNSGSTMFVAFTTVAWTAGMTSTTYDLLAAPTSSYTMAAFMDLRHEGIEANNPTVPAGDTTSSGRALIDNRAADVTGVNLTLYDPGTYGAIGALGTSTVTISGTISLTSAHPGKTIKLGLTNGQQPSTSQQILYYVSTGPIGAGTLIPFTIPNVSTAPPGGSANQYAVVAILDLDGSGSYSQGVDPLNFLGGNQAPTVVTIAQSSGTVPVGTINLVDVTNTGSISGTITIASNTLTTGRMIVHAEQLSGTGGGDPSGPRLDSEVSIVLVPGQTSYPYTISNLGTSSSYFVSAFVDTFEGQKYLAPNSTYAASGFTAVPEGVTQAFGSYGWKTCSGPCAPINPVSVSTAGAPTTGINFMLQLPTTQLPPLPSGFAVTARSTGTLTYGWSAEQTASGFRLISLSSANVSGDLLPTAASYTDGVSAPFSTNTLVSRYLVAFNANGNSTGTVVNAYTAAMPASGTYLNNVASTSVTVNWFANTNPAGTNYLLQISSNNFSTIGGSVNTTGFSTQLTGLAINTSYYFRVQAQNGDGIGAAFDTAQTTATLAVDPSTTAFSGVSTTMLTANWTANGNPSDTTYGLVLSTGANPFNNNFTGNVIAYSSTTFFTFTSLSTSTPYYVQVAALNRGIGNSPGAMYPVVSTLANPPGALAFLAITDHDLKVSWSTTGNPTATTRYSADLSTDNFASVSLTSVTFNGSIDTITPVKGILQANTTYYTRVKALNNDSVATAYVVGASSSTNADAPLSSAPSGLGAYTITDNWLANTNSTTTLYNVQIATDPAFGTLTNSAAVVGLGNMFTGLSPNTTYYSRVAAIGNNGVSTGTLNGFTALPSTTTLLLPPGTSASTFSAISNNGAGYAWTSGGNPAGTQYVAQISTSATYATLTNSSATLNTSATFSGLSPDTTYFFQVKATGASNASAFVDQASTVTPAAAPLNLLSASTTTTSATMSWSANGNPATTVYELWRDVSAAFSAPVKTGVGATSLAVSGLTPNTTYFFKVRALGANGVPAAFDTLALGTTATLTTYPTAPSTAAVTSLGVSSMTANWGANGNPAGSLYLVKIATDPAFGTLTNSTTTAATSYAFTGLGSNTTFYFQLRALGFSGVNSAAVTLDTTTTLANVPASPVAQNPTTTALGVAWSANGNAAGTQYNAQISTDNFATVNASSATPNLSATFSGLQSNSTYYLRVQAVNLQGVGTGFVAAAASSTLVAVPNSAPITSVSSVTLTANWLANGNVFTNYTVQIATDPAFGSLTNSSTTLNLSAAFLGLSPSTTYYAQVRARGNDGTNTAFTALPTTTTFIAAPFGVVPTFTNVTNTAATVAWGSNNGAGATYLVQISSMASFAPLWSSSSTANLSASFGSGGQGPALIPNVTYFFQVQAQQTGQSSLFVSLGSTDTPAAVPVTLISAATTTTSATMSWSANGNPATTVYELWRDVTSAFSAPVKTGVGATSLAVSGLTPNTTYFFKVRALGANGAVTDFDSGVLGSTVTLTTYPTAPSTAAVTSLGVSSMTANWGANGNPAGTLYVVKIATDPAFGTLTNSTTTTATSYAFTGLGSNTTFYFQLRALGFSNVNSAVVTLDTTTTLANIPASAVAQNPTTTGIGAAWSANGNAAGTQYNAQISTDNFATVNASSATLNLSAAFAGLQSNSTYYLRVQAVNLQGVGTGFVAAAASSTLVAAPTSAPLTSVSSVTLTANWLANGNVFTYYTVQVATDPAFGSLTNSSATLNLSAAFAGLSPSTTYYSRVQARGNDGTLTAFTALPSTTTFLAAPFGVAPTFTGVTNAAATVAWGSNNGAGTTYVVQVSTLPGFVPLYSSSSTLNLSAAFGAGGQGPSLTPDVTYYFQVQAQQAGQQSLFVSLGSTVTPVNAPTTSAIVAVASTTVAVSWNANGNPAYTTYEIWSDANGTFAAPAKATIVGTAYTVGGLTAGTSSYIKVRALPFSGTPSLFDTTLSTVTLPPAPGAPGAPAGAALGVSSISWTWTAATFASSYTVYSAASGASLGGGAPLAYTEISLSTNSPYGLYVQGNNGSGPGLLSAITTTYTLAMPPTGTASSLIYASSATISWSLNTNPTATTAEVQRSTDNVVFAQVSLSTPTGPSYVDPGLIGCTTYYYRVRNVNGTGVATAFDSVINFRTLNTTPTAAIGLTASPATGNLINLAWTPSPTEGITGYRLYTDSGTGVLSGTPLAVLASTAVSYTAGPFVSSAAYTFKLDAVHRCGVEETAGIFAISPASGTLANVRAYVAAPVSGQRVNGNALTLVAALAAGTPDQVSQVTFQYRATGASAWTTIPAAQLNAADAVIHPNPAPSAPYLIHWSVDGNLAPGSYDVRALAVNVAGSSDTVAAAVTIQVVAAGTNPPGVDVSQSVAAGVLTARSYVNTGVANTIQAVGPNATDPQVVILIPAGAVTASSAVVVNAANIVAISTPAPNGFPAVGTALSININGAVSTTFGGGAVAKLTFTYPAAQDPSKLEIWGFDAVAQSWSKLTGLTFDSTNHTISGLTTHFSIFQVFIGAGGGVQPDTSKIRVYPNPYKPHGTANEGGNGFVTGDFTTGIIIDNLPAEAHVKVYSISGRQVASFDTTSSNGKIQWDGRNQDGRDAATGGYFIVIKSPGSASVVKKLLIVR